MPSPTELAESLRNQVTELTKLGDFDATASRHRRTVEDLYQLAAIVERLDTEMNVLIRLLEGKAKHK